MFISYPGRQKYFITNNFQMKKYSTVNFSKTWYLLYKAEKLFVCLSVHLHFCLSICIFWHTDNSAVFAWIDTGFAWNESWGSEFAYTTHCSSTVVRKRWRCKQPLIHKASGQWFKYHSTCFLFQLNVFFIAHHHGANSEHQLNTICIDQNRVFQLNIKPQCCLILLHLAWLDTTNSMLYVLLENIDLILPKLTRWARRL